MEKRYIIQFLKKRKRGVYTLIVEEYSEIVTSMAATLALDVIREDLERVANTRVELNYFSLAHAITKFKKKTSSSPVAKAKWNFKDSYEQVDQLAAGKFKLGQ